VIATEGFDNIFVAFADLDSVTHIYGVGSKEHTGKITELDGYLIQMCRAFQDRNPDGNIFIVSDHGMANVSRSADIKMEKEFGRAAEDTYLFFVDSTMMRVWIFDEKKRNPIENYLRQQEFGEVLSAADRKKYGITSEEFGSIIFLLNEGVVFNPGFFGRKMPRAMHGYRPELESQQGLLFAAAAGRLEPFPALSAFSILEQTLPPTMQKKGKA
jgi:predicted AlkP superfamily pyrophosphatase or phosphodiesterase